MRLVDRFNPLFALAIDIQSYPVTTANKNALRETIINAVTKDQSAQVSTGISLEDMDLARAAVYFFMDEVLMEESITNTLQTSPVSHDTQETTSLSWYQNTLQNTFLQTEKGGELFFIYFEQILDKILVFDSNEMTIENALQNMQQKNTSANLLSTRLSLNEKLIRVSQHLTGLSQNGKSLLHTNTTPTTSHTIEDTIDYGSYFSGIEVLNVYAKCLLYGFHGKYYDYSHQGFLQELRQTAYTYLQIQTEETADTISTSTLIEKQKNIPLQAQLHRKTKLSYFFYAACPPLICLVWYFYCAQTVSQILL